MNGIFGSRIAAGILFSGVSAWAIEPLPAATATGDGRVVPQTASAPSQGSTPTVAANAGNSPPVSADSTTVPDATPAAVNSTVDSSVAPSPTAQPSAASTPTPASSPNSVAASPYGAAASDSATPAPAKPAPRQDAPATLLDSNLDYAIGGFGGLSVMYTRFAGSDRPLVCGEAAVIIDHTLTLGAGGCGIPEAMNPTNFGVLTSSARDRLQFGYGGAIVRYHFFSRRVTNLAVGVLIGAGGLVVGERDGTKSDGDFGGDNYTVKTQDGIFVVEPQVGGYANLTRWLRVGAAAGYHFVSGVELKGLSESDLMGPSIGGQIQGGWF